MLTNHNFIAFLTIFKKEMQRFIRIWIQTLLPPAITMTLYFVIFGNLIGPRIGKIHDYSYMQYIVPGLIMMSIMTNAYSNVVGSFYGARFQKNVEEMLVSPMSNWIILAGYITGGVARGITVGLIVSGISLFFTHLHIEHLFFTFLLVILVSILFSLAGFMNALFARNFEDIAIVPTFILTPLTYFGGVFYSIDLLPPFWQTVSHFNPILYMVDAFRYSVLGISDINIPAAFSCILIFIGILIWLNLHLLNKGTGIRT